MWVPVPRLWQRSFRSHLSLELLAGSAGLEAAFKQIPGSTRTEAADSVAGGAVTLRGGTLQGGSVVKRGGRWDVIADLMFS